MKFPILVRRETKVVEHIVVNIDTESPKSSADFGYIIKAAIESAKDQASNENWEQKSEEVDYQAKFLMPDDPLFVPDKPLFEEATK